MTLPSTQSIPSPMVLAIDPGYDRLGWAIGKTQANQLQVLDYGCITTTKTEPLFKRYTQLLAEIARIITHYQPDQLALETLFFAKNKTTALAVAEVRGMIIAECIKGKMQLFEYSPSTIKAAATGAGNATKAQVTKMVLLQLGKQLSSDKQLDDTYDALALLLTHTASVRIRKRV